MRDSNRPTNLKVVLIAFILLALPLFISTVLLDEGGFAAPSICDPTRISAPNPRPLVHTFVHEFDPLLLPLLSKDAAKVGGTVTVGFCNGEHIQARYAIETTSTLSEGFKTAVIAVPAASSGNEEMEVTTGILLERTEAHSARLSKELKGSRCD